MIVNRNQTFNLMDTNGRRADYINAMHIYLSILEKLNLTEDNTWSAFPTSLNQFKFYKMAIEASPEVFRRHPNYDKLSVIYADELDNYPASKNILLEKLSSNREHLKSFDVHIESRARHYSSNLHKIGMATAKREITEVGRAFLHGGIVRDSFETLLPITDSNIIILRQLLKFKVFSIPSDVDGLRRSYSPFLMGVYLLLYFGRIAEEDFKNIVQSFSPYNQFDNLDSIVNEYLHNKRVNHLEINYPSLFLQSNLISFNEFSNYIKNYKSSRVEVFYYEFYKALYDFRLETNELNFQTLCNILLGPEESKIKKAFGFGKPVFDLDRSNMRHGYEAFLLRNYNNDFLTSSNLNKMVFEKYTESKYFDGIEEYFDTTKRLFNASGLFKFSNGLPELRYRDVLLKLFDKEELKSKIFGVITEEEYQLYEGNVNETNFYNSNISTREILEYTSGRLEDFVSEIKIEYGEDDIQLKDKIRLQTNYEFINFVKEKYDKETIIKIINLFSDRANDSKIKKIVSKDAALPAIYEYIIGIAWYYISGENFDLYDSLNLTLNADFEPILHASGGDGDIVIEEENRVTMLEVTLMNKNAQRRAELEPVLRHSTNLKARYEDKETITFFIADELDFNTITHWRHSMYIPQIPAYGTEQIDEIMIMSFTNDEIVSFLENDIPSEHIYNKTKNSFHGGRPKNNWRDEIIESINNYL